MRRVYSYSTGKGGGGICSYLTDLEGLQVGKGVSGFGGVVP